ncbi:chromosome segregation protein SMC [Tenuibacillus multivorans]|uniref:Chromosome partition protein Smc n=1 Tax=Tenuibacillus multivorans TaxID=237069 RepID=A0A1G9Y198_9BACI|nr:chromosome segregation protein SMC [Tenuibacillus multivorans]GEL75906.1 chromosome partition protein Smc [Tenuibacillus multivorans]SDN02844.1 condensin subunit Smc [Tenuibacillus multivorans]
MLLKKLESVGFKSFAERITVDFVSGVTAVVGPNGSGKSNITDAIRWVLGEQSAKSLRGAKMEDIIFAGSETRRALNVAEVTLTLDNKDQRLPIDYEEVAVTRRVYRSGESEYLINKQPCRLKDIIDLFMDSGLGKEAFSIISQGKVEEILSSKSEERRSIFEEAAGVLKYKQRKSKAVKKLAETDDNLSRVEDIIHEIEGQLEPLKEQAAVAKEYLEKKEELEQQEVSLIVTEIEHIHTDWESLLEQIDQLKEQLMQEKTAIQKDESNVEEIGQQVQALDTKVNQLQEEKLNLTQQIEQLDGQKNVLVERLKHFDESRDKLTNDIKESQNHIDQYEWDYEDHDKRLQLLEESRHETKESINQIKQEIENSGVDIEEKIESLKAEYIDLLNDQAANRNEKSSIEKQIEQTQLRKQRLDERFEQLIEERQSLEKDQELQAKEKVQLDDHIQSIDEDIYKLQSEYEQLFSKIREDEEKLQKGYRIIEQLRSKKEMLEDMKDSYSGFFYGVKSLLQAKERGKVSGIHGAVAQLVNIPNDYVTAMETALGGQAQHIVVSTDQDARQSIKWLKQTNNGRATFLPLTTIKSRSIDSNTNQQIKDHSGFIGVASDLVQYDNQYHAIVQNLLGNVIISRTLKDANELAKLSRHRFRIVTLEGDIVNPGGSMSGGAKKRSNQTSLFTREQELKEIKTKLTDYEKKSQQFEQQLNDKKQKSNDLQQTIRSKQQDKDDFNEKYQMVKEGYQSLQARFSNINDQLAVYDQENSQYNEEINQLKQELETITRKLEGQDEQADKHKHEIDHLTSNQSNFKETVEKHKERLNHMQIRLAEQESDVRNQKERLEQVQGDLNEARGVKTQLEEELQKLEESHQNSKTIDELSQEITDTRTTLTHINDQLEQNKEKRNNLAQSREDLERELKERNRLYEQQSNHLQQLEVKANRLDVDLENRLNRLSEEYMLTFEKAKADYGLTEEIDEARENVKLIKRSIDELGTVNLGSIEEYERIQERHQFLSEQQEDLLEAKATLHSIIQEMDDEMIRKFSETFEQIQKQFSIVFKELFGGGRAELKLTNPDDLLETGVDIIAQPPGKKLQNLSLLSGGERALTAIALLFAILRVRPVPFCVLDEVEAALDEANVIRFGKYLKEFSEHTQFIVITHRKGTMENADVLYGITMQESGVSKLVSVKLEETEEMVFN